MPSTLTIDHAQGALLGAFIGDAAGATLEFLGRTPTPADLARACAMSGGGVFGLAPGQITDDGELTLALARALLEHPSHYHPNTVARHYRQWVASRPFDMGQATRQALGHPGDGRPDQALAMSQRAALQNPDSKANGALMRSSGLAVWGCTQPLAELVRAARTDAALSHPHLSCQWANVAYTVAMRHLLLQPGERSEAVAAATQALQDHAPESAEVLGWLDDAQQGRVPAAWPRAGFVRIAFTCAFHALLQAQDFASTLAWVLSLGGDTDTNACITGALVGAAVGLSGLPTPMVEAVLHCDTGQGRAPRPAWLRTTDALDLAKALVSGGLPPQSETPPGP